tara:strand:+ start:145 stop:441 length:297 start_codon:yes stop_codon:yes gene_type:complete
MRIVYFISFIGTLYAFTFLFGGPITFLKLFFWITYYIAGFYYGLAYIAWPLIESLSKKFKLNEGLSFIFAGFIWFCIINFGLILISKTEFGQWLEKTS